jgi:hypothetical protein
MPTNLKTQHVYVFVVIRKGLYKCISEYVLILKSEYNVFV